MLDFVKREKEYAAMPEPAMQRALFHWKNQPFTEPLVTPLMMNLLRQMYTISTGRMASRMNIYTLPMSNLE